MRSPSLVASSLAALIAAGCGKDGNQPAFAELYPVNGVVKRGGQPVRGGTLRFALDPEKPEFDSNAVVGPDGSYTLTTYRTTDRSGERKPGAPAGTYKVTYIPDFSDQTAGGSQEPIHLNKPLTVDAGDNDISIDLPAAKK
jgi:hypothetical protein